MTLTEETKPTATMTTQTHSGCTPATPPFSVQSGTNHFYLCHKDSGYWLKSIGDSVEAQQTIGKVAASLNAHAALVEALEDAAGFIDMLLESKTPADLLETSGENTLERVRTALWEGKGVCPS